MIWTNCKVERTYFLYFQKLIFLDSDKDGAIRVADLILPQKKDWT